MENYSKKVDWLISRITTLSWSKEIHSNEVIEILNKLIDDLKLPIHKMPPVPPDEAFESNIDLNDF